MEPVMISDATIDQLKIRLCDLMLQLEALDAERQAVRQELAKRMQKAVAAKTPEEPKAE